MTLPELVVAMSIMSLVSVVFLSTLASVQRSVVRSAEWQANNDDARVAIETIDRQLRSGAVMFSPQAVDGNTGAGFTVYTQSNAPTFRVTGTYSGARCVQWRVSGRTLQTRWWRSQYAGDWGSGGVQAPNTTGWRTIVTNVVNYIAPNNQPLFVLDTDPLKGGRTVNVVLLMNSSTTRANETVRIQAALTARNTSSGLVGACPSQP
jgi:type II secretory pathway component PulJ